MPTMVPLKQEGKPKTFPLVHNAPKPTHGADEPIEPFAAGETTIADERHGQIAARAYEIYEQRGREDGHALDDWLQAEQELRLA
jgi:hypothetical protein